MKNLKSSPLFHLLPLSLMLLLITVGCQEDALHDPSVAEIAALDAKAKANQDKNVVTYYGRTYPIYGGVMRSLVQVNKSGEIVAVGMMISERSLNNLPKEAASFVLEFPKQVVATPFTHITFEWNPMGHFPMEIYGAPHFDIHYYTISNEERMQIPFIENVPMEDVMAVWPYMPEHYVPTMVSEPHMGMHWINPASPEFAGEPFTHTMIMGSHEKKVAFFEPMFTLDYLLSKPNVAFPINPYAQVQKPGLYYPTLYSFAYDPIRKLYIFLLTGMEMR
jgi:hypothetical protein